MVVNDSLRWAHRKILLVRKQHDGDVAKLFVLMHGLWDFARS